MIDLVGRSARSQHGFTLLETLVALAILAISLGVLFPVFSASVQRQTDLADQKTATLLAQSKLDAVGSEIPLLDGISDGQFPNGFTWHVEIAPYAFDRSSAFVSPKLVTLTVHWPAKASPGTLVVKTIRLVGRD